MSSTYTRELSLSSSSSGGDDDNSDKNITLRVREPTRAQANASILIQTPEGIWDCVRCSERTEQRYTGVNWYGRFMKDEEDRLIAFGADESNFTFNTNLRSVSGENTNACKLVAPIKDVDVLSFQFTHVAWNPSEGSLELLMVEEIKEGSWRIQGQDYTSLLLFFEKVEFEKAVAPVGLKRTRVGE
jgi:hypothetical protein